MAEDKRTHIYVWLTPYIVHLKRTQHHLTAISQYEIESLKLKKKLGKKIVKRKKEGPPPKKSK